MQRGVGIGDFFKNYQLHQGICYNYYRRPFPRTFYQHMHAEQNTPYRHTAQRQNSHKRKNEYPRFSPSARIKIKIQMPNPYREQIRSAVFSLQNRLKSVLRVCYNRRSRTGKRNGGRASPESAARSERAPCKLNPCGIPNAGGEIGILRIKSA